MSFIMWTRSNYINKGVMATLVVALSMLFFSCTRGIDIDSLAIPDDIVKDAADAFITDDPYKFLEVYAGIETGTSVADGIVIDEESDASLIESATGDAKSRIFIQIPQEHTRKDHLLKSLSSADIRRKIKGRTAGRIKNFNFKTLLEDIKKLGLNEDNAREFIINAVKKVNTTSSQYDDIIIISDDVPSYLAVKEFFAPLTTPGIITLSTDRAQGKQIYLKGLHPGQTFKLIKSRLDKSAGFTGNSTSKDLAISIAKAMAAISPYGTLGQLSSFLDKIEPIIEQNPLPTGYNQKIMEELALALNTNFKHIDELKLNRTSLTQINNSTEFNRTFYEENIYKLSKVLTDVIDRSAAINDIRQGVNNIRTQDILSLLNKLGANENSLRDLRDMDLPTLQQNLIDESARLQDETIAMAKKILGEARDNQDLTQMAIEEAKHSNLNQAKKAQDQISEELRKLSEEINNTTEYLVDDAHKNIKTNRKNLAELLRKAAKIITDSSIQFTAELYRKTIQSLLISKKSYSSNTRREIVGAGLLDAKQNIVLEKDANKDLLQQLKNAPAPIEWPLPNMDQLLTRIIFALEENPIDLEDSLDALNQLNNEVNLLIDLLQE